MNEVRLAYLDGASGLAGDMLLGAVIAAGVPPQLLERRLTRALHLTGWRFETKQVLRQGLPAVHVSVVGDRVLPSLAPWLPLIPWWMSLGDRWGSPS
ncbi:MAG: DUF111 family protein [Elusimicrobia bacterium]|nr:DUF111 family protein [Elusimicrobiota bacterium]